MRRAHLFALCALAFLLSSASLAPAQTVTATIPVGTLPYSVAVNPVTNKIYVANDHSSNVTVIDGATNTTVSVAAGPGAAATAVNPVTTRSTWATISATTSP